MHSDVYQYTDRNDDDVQIFMVFTRGWLFKYGGTKWIRLLLKNTKRGSKGCRGLMP